jgi:hypothetical protein
VKLAVAVNPLYGTAPRYIQIRKVWIGEGVTGCCTGLNRAVQIGELGECQIQNRVLNPQTREGWRDW